MGSKCLHLNFISRKVKILSLWYEWVLDRKDRKIHTNTITHIQTFIHKQIYIHIYICMFLNKINFSIKKLKIENVVASTEALKFNTSTHTAYKG